MFWFIKKRDKINNEQVSVYVEQQNDNLIMWN